MFIRTDSLTNPQFLFNHVKDVKENQTEIPIASVERYIPKY